MSKKEEKRENITDLLIDVSNILERQNDDSKNTIITQLNNHFLSILNNKNETEKFFNLLRSIIFPQKANETKKSIRKTKNFYKQPFLLYPIIYSFNPNLSIDYIDNFLFSLKLSISEENKSDFTFLSSIFAEIINCFYNNQNNTTDIGNEKKEKLYQKLFSFIDNFFKINKKIDQSFGCLILAELIEKCPLVKNENNLNTLFKHISNYLDNKWFECKIDLLNCIISLIFKAEKKFKPYANVCLFRILDYLTDDDWVKRKLAINIVYTLVFYCKEEILAVKENIIEFLNILKEDNVSEVREVCLQTLKFIEESENMHYNKTQNEKYVNENNKNDNINNKEKINIKIGSFPNLSESKNFDFLEKYLNKIEYNKPENKKDNKKHTGLYKNNFSINNSKLNDKNNLKTNNRKTKKIEKNNNIKKNKKAPFKKDSSNKSFDLSSYLKEYKRNKYNEGNLTDRNNNVSFKIDKILGNDIRVNNSYTKNNSAENSKEIESQIFSKSIEKKAYNLAKNKKEKKISKKLIKKDTNQDLKEKFKNEKILLEEIEKQINERKPKQTQLSSYLKQNIKKNNSKAKTSKKGNIIKNSSINKNKKEDQNNEKKIINSNKRGESDQKIKYKESINNPIVNNINTNSNININEYNERDNHNISINDNQENNYKINYNIVIKQLNKMQESQNNILEMIKQLKNIVDNNYINLDKRITLLESFHINNNNQNNEDINSNNDLLKNKTIIDKIKLEIINNKFKSGKYNEVLIESKENDKYLFKILPLFTNEYIAKTDISVIEYTILELCLKLPKLNIRDVDGNKISIVITFFNEIIKSKKNLKSNIQLNLKDILNLMKEENNLKLSQNDIANIDNILKSIK